MSQEVRDAVAMLEGWTKSAEWPTAWDTGDYTEHWHPIPDDLTACAKAWDDHAGGLVLCMHVAYLTARERNGKGVKAIKRSGHDAASELRDRWELLGLVLKARGVV